MLPSAVSSPLADLSDPQDVGEEGFLVSDDHRLLQLSAVQEVFGEDSQGSEVRGLRCQNLEHTLPGGNKNTNINFTVGKIFERFSTL